MSSSDAPHAARRRRLLGAGAAAAALAALPLVGGCGFRLREPVTLSFRSAALAGFAPRSPLADELARALQASGATVGMSPVQVVVQALEETREKSVVASTSAAQVREFRLRLRLRFSARTPAGRELIAPAELLLERDLSYSEGAALAKQLEEESLFRAMQSDIVAQVMRRLAAIRL